jgi:hypothetical protein
MGWDSFISGGGMDLQSIGGSEARFEAYVERLVSVIGA